MHHACSSHLRGMNSLVLNTFHTSIVWKVHTRCWSRGVKSARVARLYNNISWQLSLFTYRPDRLQAYSPLLNLSLSYYCTCSVIFDSKYLQHCKRLALQLTTFTLMPPPTLGSSVTPRSSKLRGLASVSLSRRLWRYAFIQVYTFSISYFAYFIFHGDSLNLEELAENF